MSTNKVALITGANKGIGFETARQLGKLGYTVLIGSRNAERGGAATAALRADGADAHFLHVDMDNPSTFETAAGHIESQFGKLDVLVNNAGMMDDMGMSASEVPASTWRKTFETNVFSQIEITNAMLPLLKKSHGGRIVNLSSILGSLAMNADPASPIAGWKSPAYNASKTALNAYTILLANELRDTNIKVNAAHPGWVKTDLGGEGAPMELEDGAKTSVTLATLPADGPTGTYTHMGDTLPW